SATGNGRMNFLGMDVSDFSQQYLRAALMVSLLSVWLLVGLFYYLNHYTKREYFTVWTAAWLFYALWLTLGLKFQDVPPESTIFKLKQCCVAVSAVFLFWGVYLSSYPLSQEDDHLKSAGFFVAAVLQLFIAVSMIVLVLEEVRYKNEQVLAEIAA